MGCCKCEATHTGWEDPQESVWEDTNTGESYCVYHAPKSKKFKFKGSPDLLSEQEFNELIFQRINQAIAGNFACDLQECIFPYEIDFSTYGPQNSFPDINFANAEFFGFANFIGCHFSGLAYFAEAVFHERASFRSVTFVGEVDFSFAEFNSIALFDLAKINNRLVFCETILAAQTDLYATEFETQSKLLCVGLTRGSIQHLCYTKAQLLNMEFQNSRWPMRLGLDLFFPRIRNIFSNAKNSTAP